MHEGCREILGLILFLFLFISFLFEAARGRSLRLLAVISLAPSSDVSSRPGSRAVRHSSQMPTVTTLSLRPHRCAFLLAGLRCLLRMPGRLPGLAALSVRSGSYSGLCRGMCLQYSTSAVQYRYLLQYLIYLVPATYY